MRPFRFGATKAWADDRREWAEFVRSTEETGFDTILVPDHLGALSPAVAIASAAELAPRLRFCPFVLNNDFRHPAIVAQEAATLDLLTEGRFELGLGTGWNRLEYEQSGIRPLDSGGVRVARLEESVSIIRRLLAGEEVSHHGTHYQIDGLSQEPLPPQGAALPILIGGNGDRLLRVAGEHADIVNFTGFGFGRSGIEFSHFSRAGLVNRIEHLREVSGDRFEDLELSLLIQHGVVTDDRHAAAQAIATESRSGDLSATDVLDAPFVLLGTAQSIADDLRGLREELGISYFTVFHGERSNGFEQVVELLAGS